MLQFCFVLDVLSWLPTPCPATT